MTSLRWSLLGSLVVAEVQLENDSAYCWPFLYDLDTQEVRWRYNELNSPHPNRYNFRKLGHLAHCCWTSHGKRQRNGSRPLTQKISQKWPLFLCI